MVVEGKPGAVLQGFVYQADVAQFVVRGVIPKGDGRQEQEEEKQVPVDGFNGKGLR